MRDGKPASEALRPLLCWVMPLSGTLGSFPRHQRASSLHHAAPVQFSKAFMSVKSSSIENLLPARSCSLEPLPGRLAVSALGPGTQSFGFGQYPYAVRQNSPRLLRFVQSGFAESSSRHVPLQTRLVLSGGIAEDVVSQARRCGSKAASRFRTLSDINREKGGREGNHLPESPAA